jgi:hypothetical protein
MYKYKLMYISYIIVCHNPLVYEYMRWEAPAISPRIDPL